MLLENGRNASIAALTASKAALCDWYSWFELGTSVEAECYFDFGADIHLHGVRARTAASLGGARI